MARAHTWVGHRSINYGNLAFSLLAVVASFLMFLYLLTPGGLRELAVDQGTGKEAADTAAPYVFIVAENTHRVAIPSSRLNRSILTVGPLGPPDAVRHMADFFGGRTTLSGGGGGGLPLNVTVSDVYRRLLLDSHRRILDEAAAAGSASSTRSGPARRTPEVTATRMLIVDHLCSATTCTGPALTHALINGGVDATEAPAVVRAHLIGEPAAACLVGAELAANGILVAALDAHCREEAAPSVTLFGASPEAGGGALRAWCSPLTMKCAYAATPTSDSTAAGTSHRPADGPSQEVRTPTAADIAAYGHPVHIVPLGDRSFSGPPLLEGLSGLADVVYMDLDPGDTVAAVAFLRDYVRTQRVVHGERKASPSPAPAAGVLPSRMLLSVRPAAWAGDLIAALTVLQEEASFTVIALACAVCAEAGVVPDDVGVLSRDALTRLGRVLARERTASEGAAMGRPVHDRVSAVAPPTVLLAMASVDRPAAEMAARLFPAGRAAAAVPVTLTGRPTVAGVRLAADRFFDAVDAPRSPPQGRNVRMDAVSATGRFLYRVAFTAAKVFWIGLPIAICVFLLVNISKRGGRR